MFSCYVFFSFSLDFPSLCVLKKKCNYLKSSNNKIFDILLKKPFNILLVLSNNKISSVMKIMIKLTFKHFYVF